MEEKGELSAHAGMRQRKTAEIVLRNLQLDNRDHLRTIVPLRVGGFLEAPGFRPSGF